MKNKRRKVLLQVEGYKLKKKIEYIRRRKIMAF